jgi:hypothetical protein
VAAGQDIPRSPERGATFEAAVKPFVQSTCSICHSDQLQSGDLNLVWLVQSETAVTLENRELWEKILEKLKTGQMPPPGIPRPSKSDLEAVTGWIESELAALDRSMPLDPGTVTARRLNRHEYNNTVHHLLGIDIEPAEDFPVDPYSYGFDNIGDVLSVSPVLTEKYLKSARRISRIAIPHEEPLDPTLTRYMAERVQQEDELRIEFFHEFPADGIYTLRTGWYQGYLPGKTWTVRLFLDDRRILDQSVMIYTEIDRAVEVAGMLVRAGRHKISAEADLGPDWDEDTKPYLEYIHIHGPDQQMPLAKTAAYSRIFVCGHRAGKHLPACARQILEPLALRAYRRPVTAEEIDDLALLVSLAQSRGDTFEAGIRVALQAILVSPKFLFRIERDPPGSPRQGHPVSDIELASRLSFFLWSSMPDDALLRQAEQGRLHEPAVLHAEVKRMLADPKSREFVESFAGQWLQTRNLDVMKPDAGIFPEFDYHLREAMRTETRMFFDAVLREDRSVLDFLDGRFTFLNERLAKHYGIEGVTGPEFRKYDWNNDSRRSGVLTQASVLTVSSYPNRTSPVIRGKWVLDNLLNSPPPPPPPDVPALEEEGIGTTVSMREQLEKHRANALCASCHARMDPLGFSLENYDAIGRWRAMDGRFPVDASGVLPDGTSIAGPDDLKGVLRADAPSFVRALSEKMLTYALGRGLEAYDRPAIREITERVERNEYRFSELILAVVDSAPFRMRRAPEERSSQQEREGL